MFISAFFENKIISHAVITAFLNLISESPYETIISRGCMAATYKAIPALFTILQNAQGLLFLGYDFISLQGRS